MPSLPYDMDVARARIERVFRYLQELHRIRTPPALDVERYEFCLRLDSLPRHGAIQRGFDDAGASRGGVLLSVDRPGETECPAPSVRKVFNVAASRARDQLWVVHSLDPGRDLKAGDLRLRLIQHVETAGAIKPAEVDLGEFLFDSDLQGELCRILDADGYRVVPGYPVGAHAIDVVVQGAGNARVGILCDGGRAIADDDIRGLLEHQMILERLGWKLIRMRSSEYFRDPKKELERLRRRLGARGVKPVERDAPTRPQPKAKLDAKAKAKAKAKATAAEPAAASLHERVIQRAENIRSRWNVPVPAAARPAAVATSRSG